MRHRPTKNIRITLKILLVVLAARLLFFADQSLQRQINPVTYVNARATHALDFGQQGSAPIAYHWRLYDLYRPHEFDLKNRDAFPDQVVKNHTLTWSDQRPGPYFIEISTSEKFQNSRRFQTAERQLLLHELNLGANYWRVSVDGKNWSEPKLFQVDTQFLRDPPPQVESESRHVQLADGDSHAQIRMRSSFPAIGFVIESSRSQKFEPRLTRSFWSRDPVVELNFFAVGDYYYRVRGVNLSQEMTEWSLPQVFHVSILNQTAGL